eukprot:Trichotokara_eunicae@DN71_c0_g1_i2.p1
MPEELELLEDVELDLEENEKGPKGTINAGHSRIKEGPIGRARSKSVSEMDDPKEKAPKLNPKRRHSVSDMRRPEAKELSTPSKDAPKAKPKPSPRSKTPQSGPGQFTIARPEDLPAGDSKEKPDQTDIKKPKRTGILKRFPFGNKKGKDAEKEKKKEKESKAKPKAAPRNLRI